jgi:hypothetical protein
LISLDTSVELRHLLAQDRVPAEGFLARALDFQSADRVRDLDAHPRADDRQIGAARALRFPFIHYKLSTLSISLLNICMWQWEA